MDTEVISTAPKPFVFVLMPFDASFNDIYALGIRPACESAGAYCERVDEQIFQESILQRIYNQISKADVVVADMTGRNANVFYETGYAHALGKHVILLTQDGNDIPFDLKHYPHIIYGGSIVNMKHELEKRVRWCIERPNQSIQTLTQSLEIYVNGTKIEGGERINIRTPQAISIPFTLNVMLHNAGNQTYKGAGGTDFGLLLPQEFLVYDIRGNYIDSDEEAFSLPLPDGRALHSFGPLENILPDKWEGVRMFITSTSDNPLHFEKEYQAAARIYTEVGPRDVEFSIILINDESAVQLQQVRDRTRDALLLNQAANPSYVNPENGELGRVSKLAEKLEGSFDLMRRAFYFTRALSDEDLTSTDGKLTVTNSFTDMPYALRAFLACGGDEEKLKGYVREIIETEARDSTGAGHVDLSFKMYFRRLRSPLLDFHPEADRVFREVDAQLGVVCKTFGLKFPGGGMTQYGGKRELTSEQWTHGDFVKANNILKAAKTILE